MSKHTPGGWECHDGQLITSYDESTQESITICEMIGDNSESNAARIVLAVNNFDELVNGLTDIKNLIDGNYSEVEHIGPLSVDNSVDILKIVEDLLKKCKGGK